MRVHTQFEKVTAEFSFKGRVDFWQTEMGSWEGIMSKATPVAKPESEEAKVPSKGKQGVQYERLAQM